MHDRYAGKWYATLTFVQHNTATRPDDSTEHSTWHEYAALPGRLRIDFEPLDSAGGVLFVRDSQFVFRGGRLASATPFVHPLLVLGFDVHFDSTARTARRPQPLGVDLPTHPEETGGGRPADVVRGPAGRLPPPPLWGGKERAPFSP